MDNEKRGSIVKIILLGDGSVGKTSLRRGFTGEQFQENYKMTMGADFSIHRGDNDFMLQIYDLAGQDNFRAVRINYYRGSQGAILVYDVNRRKSFTSLDAWMQELLTHSPFDVPLIVVGNKIDLRSSNPDAVSSDEAIEWIKTIQPSYKAPIRYAETSVVENISVTEVFSAITDYILGLDPPIFSSKLQVFRFENQRIDNDDKENQKDHPERLSNSDGPVGSDEYSETGITNLPDMDIQEERLGVVLDPVVSPVRKNRPPQPRRLENTTSGNSTSTSD